MQSKTVKLLVLVCVLFLNACIYKQSIQQGNQFDEDAVAQVLPGQTTRNQVRFLLGTPIVADPFHQDRWDYVYYFKDGKTGRVIQLRYEVYFDGDVVERIEEINPG